MKKLLSILLSATMLLAMTACGTQQSVPVEPSQPEPSAEPVPAAEPNTDTDNHHILIAYFSWSGNTAKLAEMIADQTGGDLFAVEPETPYSDDYNTVVDQAKEEQSENARPAVANTVDNWQDYDTVFIGYPNWWSDVPMVMLTFMESYDWNGKTVVPFCTSGGGGFGNGVKSITDAAPGASILDGFHVNGSSVDSAQSDVTEWLNELNL